MSLRGTPVEERAALPDGREALVRVGVPEDPYVPRAELDTVALEVVIGDEVAATVNTVLDADDDRAAVALARDVAAGLEAGELEPTAGSLEPLADELR
jgi:hypothetical protein